MKKNIKKNIVIVTGGTGGHIFPALALGQYLIENFLNVNYVTDRRGLANKNLAKVKPIIINVKGFAGKTFFQKIYSLFLILVSFLKSIIFLKRVKPDLVLGFGSYVQVPVVLAAKILNIKIMLHEANLVLGNANKYLWNLAKVRTSAFNINNSSKNFNIVGMPVRKEVKTLNSRLYQFPKKNQKINILILGGSLGSLVLSKSICDQLCNLPTNLKKRLYVMHQSKAEHIKSISRNYLNNKIGFEVKPYFNDIYKKFNKTTLVICRSGASTVAENLVAGLPAVYIPLANSIDNHQRHNANMVEKNNAGWVLLEGEIIQSKFLKLLTKLFSSYKILERVSQNCKNIAKPNASENLYRLISGVLYEKF